MASTYAEWKLRTSEIDAVISQIGTSHGHCPFVIVETLIKAA